MKTLKDAGIALLVVIVSLAVILYGGEWLAAWMIKFVLGDM